MLLSLGVGVPHLQKMIRKNSRLAVQSLPTPLAPSEAVRTSSSVEGSDLKGENKLEKDDLIKSQMKKKRMEAPEGRESATAPPPCSDRTESCEERA